MVETEIKNNEQKAEAVPFPLKAILGQKVGMTRIFSDVGESIGVSVIHTGSCVLTRIKTKEMDGYDSIQLGVGDVKDKNCAKPYLGQFKKAGLSPVKWLREFRVSQPEKFKVGQFVPVDIFSAGDYVDITGVSKGKGFAGVKKRHNFGGLPNSHGASDKVNSRGSSGGGSGQPQRVLKGTRMAGRMGSDRVTTQKVEIVKVDPENHLILVRGPVPGANGSLVILNETVKSLKHKRVHVAAKSVKKAANVKKAAKAPAAPAKK